MPWRDGLQEGGVHARVDAAKEPRHRRPLPDLVAATAHPPRPTAGVQLRCVFCAAFIGCLHLHATANPTAENNWNAPRPLPSSPGGISRRLGHSPLMVTTSRRRPPWSRCSHSQMPCHVPRLRRPLVMGTVTLRHTAAAARAGGQLALQAWGSSMRCICTAASCPAPPPAPHHAGLAVRRLRGSRGEVAREPMGQQGRSGAGLARGWAQLLLLPPPPSPCRRGPHLCAPRAPPAPPAPPAQHGTGGSGTYSLSVAAGGGGRCGPASPPAREEKGCAPYSEKSPCRPARLRKHGATGREAGSQSGGRHGQAPPARRSARLKPPCPGSAGAAGAAGRQALTPHRCTRFR